MTDWEDVGEFSPDHHRDEFSWIQLRCRGRADQTAISQDGDAVGQPEDLVHLMRRIHDRDAARLQTGDGAEKRGDLLFGEGGGRLVHQDDVSLTSEGLGDLDHLHLRHRQGAHQAGGVDVGLEFAEQFPGAGELGAAIDASEAAARLGAQGDILGDRQVRYRHQLLMDHRDARDQGVVRRLEADVFTAPFDVSAVRSVESGEHLHQRRFTGAVLAHQRMHLSGPEVDRRRVQDGEPSEVLA